MGQKSRKEKIWSFYPEVSHSFFQTDKELHHHSFFPSMHFRETGAKPRKMMCQVCSQGIWFTTLCICASSVCPATLTSGSVALEADWTGRLGCIRWAALSFGFWLGSTNGRHLREIGEEYKEVGALSPPLPPCRPHVAHGCLPPSASAVKFTVLWASSSRATAAALSGFW